MPSPSNSSAAQPLLAGAPDSAAPSAAAASASYGAATGDGKGGGDVKVVATDASSSAAATAVVPAAPAKSVSSVSVDAKRDEIIVCERCCTCCSCYNMKFENGGDLVGSTLTTFAMVPQGVLGGLLAYSWTAGSNPYQQLFLGGSALLVAGYASFEGKRMLVRFYNNFTFKNLSRKDFDPRRLRELTKSEWLILPLNGYLIYVAAKTFAGLAFIALNNIAENVFRHDFGWHAVANVVGSPWFGLPFAASSFLANLPSFKFIHRAGVELIASGLQYLFENPAYRRERRKLERTIEHLRVKLRDLAKDGKWDDYNDLIQRVIKKYSTETRNSIDLDKNSEPLKLQNFQNKDPAKKITISDFHQRLAIVKAMNDAGYNDHPDFNDISDEYNASGWFRFALQNLTAGGLSALAIGGLNNFVEMTEDTNAFLDRLSEFAYNCSVFLNHSMSANQSSDDCLYDSHTDFSALNTVEGNLNYYFCMLLLALISVFPFVASRFNREEPLSYVPENEDRRIRLYTGAICFVGGMPNSYQSVLVGQGPLNVFAAGASSALNEMGGFYPLLMGDAETKYTVDLNKKTAIDNDRYLQNLADLRDLPQAELHRLVNASHKDVVVHVAASGEHSSAAASTVESGAGLALLQQPKNKPHKYIWASFLCCRRSTDQKHGTNTGYGMTRMSSTASRAPAAVAPPTPA